MYSINKDQYVTNDSFDNEYIVVWKKEKEIVLDNLWKVLNQK
jgi:hypothetical protein